LGAGPPFFPLFQADPSLLGEFPPVFLRSRSGSPRGVFKLSRRLRFYDRASRNVFLWALCIFLLGVPRVSTSSAIRSPAQTPELGGIPPISHRFLTHESPLSPFPFSHHRLSLNAPFLGFPFATPVEPRRRVVLKGQNLLSPSLLRS